MKRRLALPTLAILIAPLALGVSSVHASGGDDDRDDSEQGDDGSESSVPTTSVPGSSVPAPVRSTVPGSSRGTEMLAKLNGLINRIGLSPLPESVKQELRGRVEALIAKLSSGQRVESRDLEALGKALENALRAARPSASTPPVSSAPSRPSFPPSTPPTSIDDSSDDDSSDDDSDDGDDSSVSIPGQPSFDIDKVRRDGNQVRGDLLSNVSKAIAALETLPAGEARDAVLAALNALRSRVEAGQTVPFDEVRDVFRAVAELVRERVGDDVDDDDDVAPARGEVPGEMQRQRMLGAVNQAIALLAGDTSEAAVAATSALQAVKATLEAGELPTREEFESAIRLAREALDETPAAKAILTLAGVISAVEASNMPADVKAELLVVLNAAKDRLVADPTADPRQVVRDALNRVREARIAASVQKMLAIATRLETAATTAGNTDALLLITEARALLQPSDASLPDRDDLHRARRILVRVAIMLRPVTPPSTTVPPTTEAPSTTTSAPTTEAPSTTTP